VEEQASPAEKRQCVEHEHDIQRHAQDDKIEAVKQETHKREGHQFYHIGDHDNEEHDEAGGVFKTELFLDKEICAVGKKPEIRRTEDIPDQTHVAEQAVLLEKPEAREQARFLLAGELRRGQP